jgi:hypothetical protein
MAPFYSDIGPPRIVIWSTSARAPLHPAGFLREGIYSYVSAAGEITPATAISGEGSARLGTLGTILIVVGGAAATAGVVVGAGDGPEASPVR